MSNEEKSKKDSGDYKRILKMSLDAIVSSDEEGRIMRWNPAAESMFGYTREEALGMSVEELMPEEYRKKQREGLARFIRTEEPVLIGRPVEVEGLRKDGSRFPNEISLSAEKVEGRWIFTAIMRDVTERKRAEEDLLRSETRLSTMLETANDAIITMGEDERITSFNKAAERMFGQASDEVLGRSVNILMPERYRAQHHESIRHVLAVRGSAVSGKTRELEALRRDGSEFPISITMSATELEGRFSFLAIIRDITERKQAEEQLKEAATKERLTKLLNRFSFEKDEKGLKNPMLLLINIDGFKHVNDFYGIQAGDFVLKEFAVRLKNIIPDDLGANIYKLGGDDFGVLFEDTPEYEPGDLAKKIVDGIETDDFVYEDYNISINITVGISRERPLLEKADMVLKHLKKRSRLKYLEYSEELNLYRDISENLRMLNVLKRAFSRDAVVSYFQPILNNKTGKIEKHESLVRVIDEDGQVLSPGSFLQVAKEAKLYGEITKRMIEKNFETFKDNHEFSINLSIEDIDDKVIDDFITAILERHPKIARRITFEILESEGIENYDAVSQFVKKIKKYGCKIAIDDFGSGYSNFGRILSLDVDFIKIDASLIKNVDKSKNSQVIVETIVSFAKRLGITTVAEFVHSEEVYQKVKELGIDYSQGYYIGKPKPTID